jgi:CheY-like chemotaxis protein
MTSLLVLHVEDDDNDVLLMRRAWMKAGVRHRLQTVSDGEEAIRYLSGEGPYVNRVEHPMPTLVLLDLNLPKVLGLEVLKWIRAQPSLAGLRVIVFSSSTREADRSAAAALGATAYFVKPNRYDNWVAMVTALKTSWLEPETP